MDIYVSSVTTLLCCLTKCYKLNLDKSCQYSQLLGAAGQDTSVAETEGRFRPSHRGEQSVKVTL